MATQDLGTLTLAGSAATSATMAAQYKAVSPIQGTAIFYIDPALITVKRFFKPTLAGTSTVVQPRAVVPAQIAHSLQIRPTNRKPPNTQGGGVPNEG